MTSENVSKLTLVFYEFRLNLKFVSKHAENSVFAEVYCNQNLYLIEVIKTRVLYVIKNF